MRTEGAQLRVRETEGGEASRTITGYAILFDTPSSPLWSDETGDAREVIAPEAVTKELLDSSDIKFTMFHDRQLILGRSNKGQGTLEYFIDEKGVGFNLELPKSPNGDEALELVRRGDLSGCSFAFSTYYYEPGFVDRTVEHEGDLVHILYTVRQILSIYDFTLAADPAYPDTSVEARELVEGLKKAAAPKQAEPAKDEKKIREQVREMRRAASQKLI